MNRPNPSRDVAALRSGKRPTTDSKRQTRSNCDDALCDADRGRGSLFLTLYTTPVVFLYLDRLTTRSPSRPPDGDGRKAAASP